MRSRLVSVARRMLGERYEVLRARIFGYPAPVSVGQRAANLIAAGLFDADYYKASARLPEQTSPEEAAHHFVATGAGAGLPFHPLIEAEYLPDDVRQALQQSDIELLIDHLSSSTSSLHAWGPLFDPSRLPAAMQTDSPGLVAIRSLTQDTSMPIPADFAGPVPTWAEARANAIAHVALAAEQRAFRVASTSPVWDAAEEQAWLRSISSVEVPLATDDLPIVTIVMPAWNREDAISESIVSVMSQSLTAWELIVVDDGSTDQTAEVVNRFAQSDDRIVVVSEEHRGVCAARNLGLKLARGEFIAFLDSDNTWTPEFLDHALRGMVAGDHDVVYAGIEIREPGGELRYRGMQVDAVDLEVDNSIDLNSLVARVSVVREIGGFDESLRRWVDHDLVIRLAKRTPLQFLPFVGCSYEHHDHSNRITNRESSNWQFVVLGKAVVDWQASASRLRCRNPGRVSVIMLTYQDHRRTRNAVDRVLETTEDEDVEIILVDNGSRHAVGRVLDARFAQHPRVTYRRLRRNYNFATGANFGFTLSSGANVVFLNNDTEVRDGWLAPLKAAMHDPDCRGSQPLLTYPDGTIQTAGTVFPLEQGLPCHFLPRHPVMDAIRHDGEGFHAITAGAMLTRADEFQKLRGFDPIFANGLEDVDYCLRAVRRFGGAFRVESSAVVVHEESKSPGRFAREIENRRLFLERWRGNLPGPDLAQYEKLDLEVAHTVPDHGNDHGLARPMVVRPARAFERSGESVASLRWAIKIGAASTPAGDLWGDVPFANDLAVALAEHGQEPVIDRYDAIGRSTSYLDDVVLTIRGRHPVPPQAGRLNILWVISRPELVSVAEVQSYDLVFAASARWAEWMSAVSGRPVQVLLQATNPARFHDRIDAANAEELVFVGGPRPGQGRQIVSDALDCGLTLGVWGPGWENYVSPEFVRAQYVGANDVASVYRSGIVLNDHLPEMARWGFISNRIFDAVAAGATVISDPIDGLDLFEGAAVSYESPDDLRRLANVRNSWQPSPSRLSEIAARIRRDHSFDARASALVRAVVDYRNRSGDRESLRAAS